MVVPKTQDKRRKESNVQFHTHFMRDANRHNYFAFSGKPKNNYDYPDTIT